MSKIDDKDRFYYDKDFLASPSGRSVRILSEYYGPLQRLQRNKISDTIVFLVLQGPYHRKTQKRH